MEDSDRYEACSQVQAHLQALLERLPYMQQVQERLKAHHAAGQLLSKYACVDDLEGDIEELEAKDPARSGVNPDLFERLLKEKRDALAGERARFERDLAASPFASVPEAARARIPQAEALALEDEFNRYRDDYALSLALFQAQVQS